jgi:hypothetical protein
MTFVQITVVVEDCAACKKPMLPKSPALRWPALSQETREAQAKRLGVALESTSYSSSRGGMLCTDCAEAGADTFVCVICKLKRSTGQEQESFGFPAESVCKACYATVPAKEWERVVDRLEDRHKYDFD